MQQFSHNSDLRKLLIKRENSSGVIGVAAGNYCDFVFSQKVCSSRDRQFTLDVLSLNQDCRWRKKTGRNFLVSQFRPDEQGEHSL